LIKIIFNQLNLAFKIDETLPKDILIKTNHD